MSYTKWVFTVLYKCIFTLLSDILETCKRFHMKIEAFLQIQKKIHEIEHTRWVFLRRVTYSL